MYLLLSAAGVAFVLAVILTPVCRNLAAGCGWLDVPDPKRKLHSRPIPRIGGIAIALSYLACFGIVLLCWHDSGDLIRDHLRLTWQLFPAAALIFVTGLVDDLIGLRPWQKLAGQTCAAVVAFAAGVRLTMISGMELNPWLTMPATVLWLVGCSNAFNLIDGIDGLAAGVGIFATLTTLMAALIQHNLPLALATAPLAGALLGFLRYNFNPASVFLGDCGSLLIGFLLGCYGVLWSQKSATVLGMTAPLMVLAIPLLDTALAIVRRFLRRQPIFAADRGHIHHRLLARGLTPRRAVLLLYGICGIAAALSLLQSVFQEQLGGAILVLFCVGAWLGIQHLGYAEFIAARRILSSGGFRRHVSAQLQLTDFRDDLTAADTPDQCWNVLCQSYSNFGFNKIQLELGGRVYTHTTNGHHIPNSWTIQIALSDHDYVNLSREFDTEAPPIVTPYADMIGTTLRPKIRTLVAPYPPSSTSGPAG
jgi:UDP-GlcNAc:undecaprenyl-phosphate GlcNAc-1-phosphate transferase